MSENPSILTIMTTIACCTMIMVVLLAPIAWITYTSRRKQKAVIAAWEPLASRNGLTLEQKGVAKRPLLGGVYRNRRLTLSYGAPASSLESSARRLYTTLRFEVNVPGSHWMSVRRIGFAEKAARSLSAQVVRTGDEDFDRQFLVMSQPPDAAIRLLANNPVARGIVASLSPGWFGVTFYRQTLSYEEEGVITDADRLQILFDRVSELADQFEGR